jgi:DNA-binding NarL/FixJ family response regulator
VASGETFVSAKLVLPLLKRLLNKPARLAPEGIEGLTDRELQIFDLLAQGFGTREVAERLRLSCKTVNCHRAKIQHRLGVGNAAALVQCAFARSRNGGQTSPVAMEVDGSLGFADTFETGTNVP